MNGWHCRCDDEDCPKRCRRPGCLEPGVHLLAKTHLVNKRRVGEHIYVCTVPHPNLSVVGVAKQAIEELNPNMGPSEVATARRVIGKMLDRLEQLEHTAVTVIPSAPLLLTAPTASGANAPSAVPYKKDKRPPRPHVVREITHARESHLEWLAQRKERTA